MDKENHEKCAKAERQKIFSSEIIFFLHFPELIKTFQVSTVGALSLNSFSYLIVSDPLFCVL